MEFNETSFSRDSWKTDMGLGEQVFLSSVGIIMGIIGGIGNGVVVTLVCCSSAMRSAINLLLATLAFCDTLLLLLILPLDIVTVVGRGWLLPTPLCYAHEFLLTVMQIQGVLILTVICIDRYIIIVHRQDLLTPFAAMWIIIGICIFSICIALPPLLGVGSYIDPPLPASLTHCIWSPTLPPSVSQLTYACAAFSMIYLLPLLIICACFGSILVRVHQNAAKIHNNREDTGSEYNGVVPCSQDKGEGKPSSSRRPLVALDLRYKTRTFTTILALFFVFLLCRSPLHLVQLAKAFSSGDENYYRAHIWLLWWAYFQPAVNPIIYTVRIKTIREELLGYFPWLLKLVPGPPGHGYRRSDPKSIYMIHQPRPSGSE